MSSSWLLTNNKKVRRNLPHPPPTDSPYYKLLKESTIKETQLQALIDVLNVKIQSKEEEIKNLKEELSDNFIMLSLPSSSSG
jgi:hypothetical protein